MDPISNHIIVCGLGRVGYRTTLLLLSLGEQVVCITRSRGDDMVSEIEARCQVIFGDARNDNHLLAAGIERARAILALTDEDMTNVSIALDAQRMNPAIRVVVRVFDQELGI